MQHFQDMARGHFTVRRLERKYGERLVRVHYEMLTRADGAHRAAVIMVLK